MTTLTSSSFALSHPLTSVSSPTPTSTEPWSEEAMLLVVKREPKCMRENTSLGRQNEGAQTTNASSVTLASSFYFLSLSLAFLSSLACRRTRGRGSRSLSVSRVSEKRKRKRGK